MEIDLPSSIFYLLISVFYPLSSTFEMAGSNGSGDGHKFGYRPIDTSVDCAVFGLIQHVSMNLYIVTADRRFFSFPNPVLPIGGLWLSEVEGSVWEREKTVVGGRFSSYGNTFIQINILNVVEEFDAVGHRPLEGFATGDKPHAATPFIDHRRKDRIGKVVLARSTAGINQTGAAHVVVGNLPADHINGVVGNQFPVHLGATLAKANGLEATIVFGQFLFDNIGLDGYDRVCGRLGQVGGGVVIDGMFLESRVTQVAP